MKKFKLSLLLSVLTFSSFACAPSQPSTELTNKNPALSATEPALEFNHSPGTNGKTWVLIHGLGDDKTRLDALAAFAKKDGYGVLQMDLQGHGLTLFKYLQSHENLPAVYNYEQNVIDVEKLILSLNIQDQLIIVGHSYGGAIAYALAARIKKNKSAHIHSVHMLAPYVQRIDKFIKTSYNPYRSSSVDDFTDPIMDPLLDQYMKNTFRIYLIDNYYKDHAANLSANEEKELDYRIQAAIRVTKGIRKFDLLDTNIDFLRINSPLQILGGHKDQLVVPAQLEAFDRRLTQENVPHQFSFMDDQSAGHLFPRQIPEAVYKKIISFVIATP